jgi:TolB-like protein/Tfp pilus assembly protein PilF
MLSADIPMTPEQWARVKTVFSGAVDQPPDRRTAYVAERCAGDDALLTAVTRLLAAHDRSGTFLDESPVAAGLAVAAAHGRWSGRDRGPYRFGRRIGAGGMGEVYEAVHTRSGSRTAIKVLTEEGEHAVRKLRREARHGAALEHPNICAIHEVTEDEAGAYIAMEFIEGAVLSDATPAGGFDVDRATELAGQLADAIAHAHDRGIVHRDLTSTNLMLAADGRLKVLDFGLARRLPGPAAAGVTTATLTEAGAVAGTLGYLAPEVLRGDRADARSDVWAFGIILHELLTGSRPFEGQTPFALTSSVLHEAPAPLPSAVPAGLQVIRDNCLAKDPADRYQSGREVRDAFRVLGTGGRLPRRSPSRARHTVRWIAAAASLALVAVIIWFATGATGAGDESPVVSVVVLPFDAAGGPSQEYFADGLTEAISGRLGTIDALRVISRVSARRFSAKASIADVRAALHVDAVVRGSVARDGDRVRLSAELVQTGSERVLWQDTFELDAREVLALESDTAQAIIEHLGVTVSASAKARLAAVRTVAPAVFENYLKGRFYWNKRTVASLEQAVAFFESAIAGDPTYAPAHAALADCYNQMATAMVGTGSPADLRPRARAEAVAAIQVDESLAEAHATLGYVSHYDWDWAAADREFNRALALNPNLALARIWYANYLASRQRLPEAVAEVQRAEQLDPFSRVVVTNVGWTLSMARRSDEAAAAFRRAIDLDPGYVQAHDRLAGELASAGRYDESIVESRRAVELAGRSPSSLASLAQHYAQAGRRAEAEAVLSELLDISRTRYVSPVGIYEAYFRLGDREHGFSWLETAVRERANGIVYLAFDSGLDGVRDDPRYQRIVLQVGLPDGG